MSKYYEVLSSYRDKDISFNHALYKNPFSKTFPVHTHNICEIIFIKSGNVSACFDAKTYRLKKDSIIIFRPDIPHRIQINSNEDYERYNILFDEGSFAGGAFYRIPETVDLIDCGGNTYITELLRRLDYYCRSFGKADFARILKNITEELVYNLLLMSREEQDGSIVTVNPVVRRAVEYINEHFTEAVTVDDISRELCITKSYFHHLFVEALQISPKRYVNMKRLSMAQKLIRKGEKPSDVYVSCGFDSYTTFFRNYKASFGHVPSRESEILPDTRIID